MILLKTFYPIGAVNFIIWIWDVSKTEIWFKNKIDISSISLTSHEADIRNGTLIRKNK